MAALAPLGKDPRERVKRALVQPGTRKHTPAPTPTQSRNVPGK
jgi:hypothetical protein